LEFCCAANLHIARPARTYPVFRDSSNSLLD